MKIDEINRKYYKYSVKLDKNDLSIKTLLDIKITAKSKLKFNYIGTVCTKTNKPHRFCRAIRIDKTGFADG